MDASKITLAVLAGGQGVRMGGPKAMLRLDGKPILEWLLAKWNWPGPTILVTAPSVAQPPGGELFDRQVVDPVDGLGPLRGMLTALENAGTETVCMATVDMPCVECEHILWLADALAVKPRAGGVMCAVGSRVEPFPSVFRSTAARTIRNQLENNHRSVRDLCENESILQLPPPANWAANVWTNLNTQADLDEFVRARPSG